MPEELIVATNSYMPVGRLPDCTLASRCHQILAEAIQRKGYEDQRAGRLPETESLEDNSPPVLPILGPTSAILQPQK